MAGRAPSGQALAVPATPANAVDGPSGFDPSRDAMIYTNPEFRDVIFRVLDAMSETDVPECYVGFSYIATNSGLPLERVKVVVRFLANLDYAEFARGLMSDDGEMRGAGYALTSKGFALLDRIYAIATEARRAGTGNTDPVHEGAGLEEALPETPNHKGTTDKAGERG